MTLTTQQLKQRLTLCLQTPTKMLSKEEVKGWLEGVPMSAEDKERVSERAHWRAGKLQRGSTSLFTVCA